MSALSAVIHCTISRVIHRSYSLYRLCTLAGARNGVIHPTVLIEGRGKPFFGSAINIGKNARLNCASSGVLVISDSCHIGESAKIIVANNCQLHMASETSIGASSELVVLAKWTMASGSHIASGCQISTREPVAAPGKLVLGEGTCIGDNSLIDLSGDLILGRNISIGPCCIIYTHNHRYMEGIEASWKSPIDIKPIVIDDGAWVGTGVIILPGVHIGKMAVIAAGSVVNKDVPDYGIYGGIPAKALRTRSI